MVLNEDTFLVYALRHYQAPGVPTLEEFEEDIKTLTYIKKHLGRSEVHVRLLLNHLITLFNCFDEAALYLLFYRVDREHWPTLVTFLVYINRMPDVIPDLGIRVTDFTLDEKIIKELKRL